MATQKFSFKSLLNGLPLPTLEEISVVTLAIQLLHDGEVKKIYCEHFSDEYYENHFSDSKVSELTSFCKSLQLPDILLAKVVSCFQLIREQYFNWIYYVVQSTSYLENAFSKKIDYIIHVMNSVKWSMGAIDRAESIHQLFLLENIKDDDILKNMFSVASSFCLEDDLKIFWKKMSHTGRKDLITKCKDLDYDTYYWTCKMRGNMREFMKGISNYLELNLYLDEDVDFKDPNNYALVLYIFECDVSGVKYVKNLANTDSDQMEHIIRKFLKKLDHDDYLGNCNGKELDQSADKLHFLLKEIEDEDILNDIFHEFFRVILKISFKYKPWNKFFLTLVGIWGDHIDNILLYDLITQLVEDVKIEKADIYQVKMLWEKIPNQVKKSFCSYISNKQEDRDVSGFWENMTVEVFDLILEDEELRNVLTPYENYGILKCIYSGRGDFIKFWLQKVLGSEEAIFSYSENFIHTYSIGVIENLTSYRLSYLNQFLNWAFKYEDLMSRDKILEIKDQVNTKKFIQVFIKNLGDKENWDDLKKLMDWMLRNRNHEYEDEFVNWKQKVIEKLFDQRCYFSEDFTNALCAFLSYGVNDFEKIKIMMRKADLNESFVYSYHSDSDFVVVDRYLRFLEGYGLDIFLIKNNILYDIFYEPNGKDFENEKFCENIRKLLYWNCESDQEMKTKLEEIKKEIIEKIGLKCILKCVRNRKGIWHCVGPKKWAAKQCYNWNLSVVMNKILKFLFERKIKDEKWSEMLYDLKIKVINKLDRYDLFKEGTYNDEIVSLINWGGEHENIRERNWDIKKYFIEWLENNMEGEVILKLILERNFVSSFFERDEARVDFEKTLWDLKELLVNEVIGDDDDALTCQLLENLKNFSDLLKWNHFDEERIQDLKIKILVRLFIIHGGKFSILLDFLNWCIPENSNGDLKSNILKLKKGVLEMIVSKYSENWDKEYFKRLDNFLFLDSIGDVKVLKKTAVENYGAKGCCQCLIDQNLIGLKAFMKWAEIKDKESIKNLKRNILIEILDAEYDSSCKDLKFWQSIHKFLCDSNDRGLPWSMKLNILEGYLCPVFVKLIAEKNRHKLKRFLRWFFDKNLKRNECLPRTQKLVKEMFEEFGRDYCIILLMEHDSGGVIDFWNLCSNLKIGIEITSLPLWSFIDDCINEVLETKIKKTLEDENDWNPLPDDFWNCLNKFMISSAVSYSLKNKILDYKMFVAQKYGVVYMEKYFHCLLKNSSHKIPANFLKWLFAAKSQKKKIVLNREKLYDFKKQVLEMLVSVKHKDLWEKDYFYNILDEFLKFKLAPGDLNVINDLKKSVCEVQGVELCYNWIHNSQ